MSAAQKEIEFLKFKRETRRDPWQGFLTQSAANCKFQFSLTRRGETASEKRELEFSNPINLLSPPFVCAIFFFRCYWVSFH